jgi:hypothetical protein
MNIANTPAVQSASAAAQGDTADAVNMLVLKKALNQQASAAAALIEALPTLPPLATSGSVGTRLNTFA